MGRTNHSILIIDDDPQFREIVSGILKAGGYAHTNAATGKEALDRVEEEAPAVALIDLTLEDISGLKVMEEIKKRSPGTECIMLTSGSASQASAIEAVNLGAYTYVQKPCVMEQLLVTIRRAIEKREVEEALQQSLKRLRRALDDTVHTLTSVIEIRDPYTASHQRRVAELACAIAERMGLSKDRVEGLRMAGLIHDIGKIAIPAEVLSKPGQLNELEWGLIKAHPQVGYDMLKAVEFSRPVAEIVLQHHERIDGSGYPRGLSGEEIILEARILAVADVVEAMASHRPYRGPRGVDKALEEISQNGHIIYDPKVVDACLRLFTRKEFTFDK